MEKGAAGSPQGHMNPGTSRTSPAAYPTCTSGSGGGGWKRTARAVPRQPPTSHPMAQENAQGAESRTGSEGVPRGDRRLTVLGRNTASRDRPIRARASLRSGPSPRL
jgi:hypothetical protein